MTTHFSDLKTAPSESKAMGDWREDLDSSFGLQSPTQTILRDGKWVQSLELNSKETRQSMLYCGTLIHDTALILTLIARDRLGVIEKLTELVRDHFCNIVACQGDLLQPKLPDLNDPLFRQDAEEGFFEMLTGLNSLRLHQSTFMITGKLEDLRLLWNEMTQIKDLPNFYLDRTDAVETYILEGIGQDRIGILQDICTILYDHQINMQSLLSRVRFNFDPEKSSAVLKLQLEIPKGERNVAASLEKSLHAKLREWNLKLYGQPNNSLRQLRDALNKN
jgi:glycine cleavage system regulatory protein